MPEENKPGVGAGSTGVISLGVAAAVAVAVKFSAPLHNNRPTSTTEMHGGAGLQNIDARLWEDPFFAVDHADRVLREEATRQWAASIPPKSIPETCPSFASVVAKLGNSQFSPLFVMLPGGTYDLSAEVRRRTRYAVLAALARFHLREANSEHIGCVTLSTNLAASLRVPFEELYQFGTSESRRQPRQAIVYWLDEDELLAGGACAIDRIRSVIGSALPASVGHTPQSEIAIIGPYHSQTLSQYINPEGGCKPSVGSTPVVHFFNYAATANLMARYNGQNTFNTAEWETDHDVTLTNVVLEDSNLGDAIADELKLRGIRTSVDPIVLIHESDTTYGQTLPTAVRDSLAPDCKNKAYWQCSVRSYSYFRGLDGSLPKLEREDLASPPGDATAKNATTDKSAANPNVESARNSADGQAQFDYVERLGWDLHDHWPRPSAIGVLGTDVYDKLILLQSLRPKFPGAVFFTTDLDARLADPTESSAARGLIVASSFGLRLDDSYQQETPPFRDTYQTSAYVATLLAIADGASMAPDGGPIPDMTQIAKRHAGCSRALTYVIGRGGPIELPTTQKCLLPANVSRLLPPTPPIYNDPKVEIWKKCAALAFVLISMAMVFLDGTLASPRQPADSRQRKSLGRWARGYWSIGMLATTMVLFLMTATGWFPGSSYILNWLTAGGVGEPLLLLSGISAWPIVIMRLLSFAFSLWAIIQILSLVRANSEKIERDFCLYRESYERKATRSTGFSMWFARVVFDNIVLIFSRAQTNVSEKHNSKKHNSAKTDPAMLEAVAFWEDIHYAGLPLSRAKRAVIYTVSTCVSALLLLITFPWLPLRARSNYVAFASHSITCFDVFITLLVVFLVFDAVQLSRLIAASLEEFADSSWSPDSISRFFLRPSRIPRILMSDWLDMKVVAERSKCIIGLIYYPFFGLGLLAVSAIPWESEEPLNILIVTIIIAAFLLLIYICVSLRLQAEHLRDHVRMNYLDHIATEKGRSKPDSSSIELLETWLTRVATFDEGAFAPFSRQPLLKAVLLLVTGLGGTAVVQQALMR